MRSRAHMTGVLAAAMAGVAMMPGSLQQAVDDLKSPGAFRSRRGVITGFIHTGGTLNSGINAAKRRRRAEIEAMKRESPQLGGWKKRLRIQEETTRQLTRAL